MIHNRNYRRASCDSWPECNCGGPCEVRRFLNPDEPRFGWFEYLFIRWLAMLGWLVIGVIALLWAAWPS